MVFSLFFSFRGRGDYIISCGEILLKLTKFCNSASYIIITNKKKYRKIVLLFYQYVAFENERKIVNKCWFVSVIFKTYVCITAKLGLLHISYSLITSLLCLKLRILFQKLSNNKLLLSQ